MSRLDGRYVDVVRDDLGRPTRFTVGRHTVAVNDWASRHREWIGVLDDEAQRDVWLVTTDRGVAELHRLCHPKADEDEDGGDWVLFRWED